MKTTRLTKDDKIFPLYEDDLERFFPCKAWEVPTAQVWRWRAACQALREKTGEG